MAAVNKLVSCGLVTIILAAVGCSPSATTKPEPGAASSAAAKPAAPSPGEGQRGATSESTTRAIESWISCRKESHRTPAGPLKEIYFSFDRYDLEGEARETLKVNADWLKRNPAARIEIEGHCDERGTNEYNLALGAKRAQAAKDYLITLGICY